MSKLRKYKRTIARGNMEVIPQMNKDKFGNGSFFSNHWREYCSKETMINELGADIYEPREPRKHYSAKGDK